jgi:hypothetical protein
MKDNKKIQLTSEADRNRLREYLEGRVRVLAKQERLAGEADEAAFVEGAQMEILCAYDDLLGEQMPDPKTLRKKQLGRGKMSKCVS